MLLKRQLSLSLEKILNVKCYFYKDIILNIVNLFNGTIFQLVNAGLVYITIWHISHVLFLYKHHE